MNPDCTSIVNFDDYSTSDLVQVKYYSRYQPPDLKQLTIH